MSCAARPPRALPASPTPLISAAAPSALGPATLNINRPCPAQWHPNPSFQSWPQAWPHRSPHAHGVAAISAAPPRISHSFRPRRRRPLPGAEPTRTVCGHGNNSPLAAPSRTQHKRSSWDLWRPVRLGSYYAVMARMRPPTYYTTCCAHALMLIAAFSFATLPQASERTRPDAKARSAPRRGHRHSHAHIGDAAASALISARASMLDGYAVASSTAACSGRSTCSHTPTSPRDTHD